MPAPDAAENSLPEAEIQGLSIMNKVSPINRLVNVKNGARFSLDYGIENGIMQFKRFRNCAFSEPFYLRSTNFFAP